MEGRIVVVTGRHADCLTADEMATKIKNKKERAYSSRRQKKGKFNECCYVVCMDEKVCMCCAYRQDDNIEASLRRWIRLR